MHSALIARAPGIAFDVEPIADRLRPVELDVAAFAGVAPRGPARQPVVDARWTDDRAIVEFGRPHRRTVPVAVESWTEYETLFGGLRGPGRLGQAVASFFDQGGRRAWILRVVAQPEPGRSDRPDGNGASRGELGIPTTSGGIVDFYARNEGTWGDGVRLRLRFTTRPITMLERDGLAAATVRTDLDSWAPIGSLLRITSTLPDSTTVRSLRWVRDSRSDLDEFGTPTRLLDLVTPPPGVLDAGEVVEAMVEIVDLDPAIDRSEFHSGLGLSSEHPRWLAKELSLASALVFPGAGWAHGSRLDIVDPVLAPLDELALSGGHDGYAAIEPDDFVDHHWTPGATGDGVHAMAEIAEPAMILMPDLYDPTPLQPDRSLAETPRPPADFEPCLTSTPISPGRGPEPALANLERDPRIREHLERIIDLQQIVVRFAERTGRHLALLDVPPGLTERQILSWRQSFNSSYAAAYHPWLRVPDPDGRNLRAINPSAAAAGIIAQRERRKGVPAGPANELVAGAVDVAVYVTQAEHDRLHPAAINVYRRERDGIRLLGARTLSRTTDLRQLSVRRLVMLLLLTLERRLLWTVFEPNTRALRERVTGIVAGLLRELFTAGAFAGATEEESFFVRVDHELNPPRVVDAGQLVVEIGIAPSEPVEFIVVRLGRQGDGTLTVDTRGSWVRS